MLWINIKLHTFFPPTTTQIQVSTVSWLGLVTVHSVPSLHLLLAFVSFGSFNSVALQPPPPFLDGRMDGRTSPPSLQRVIA